MPLQAAQPAAYLCVTYTFIFVHLSDQDLGALVSHYLFSQHSSNFSGGNCRCFYGYLKQRRGGMMPAALMSLSGRYFEWLKALVLQALSVVTSFWLFDGISLWQQCLL